MMRSNNVKKIYSCVMLVVVILIVVGNITFLQADFASLKLSYVRGITIDNMGMLICGILLLGIYFGKSNNKQNHAMFMMIFSLTVLFYTDLLTSCLEGNSAFITRIVTVNTLAFVFEDLLGYAYWKYIRSELELKGKFADIANRIVIIATIVFIILDIVNVKAELFFTVSDAGEYIDLPYEFLGDLAIITVFVLAIISIIKTANRRINEKLILMSFEVFPFAAYMTGVITHVYIWVYPAYLLSILLIYIRIFSEKDKKIAEQQVLLTKQNTALMISQIQPHFLYNVLTTISNLCVTDPEEAEETTVLFSQYLRTNLDSLRNQEPVLFSTELKHIKTYVELEKKRFGDILSVEYDIKEQNFKVPSLGIQPIVENSIKHGIRGKNAPGHITISTYSETGKYKIIIEDDGVGFDINQPPSDDGKSHVGINNVRERLKQMCNASMTIESSPGNGCRTEITIPM